MILFWQCSGVSQAFLVLEYEDFGPQAMAYEMIGMQWWQWQNHGAIDPSTQYDINVVVYRGVPIEEIKTLFPVDRSAHMDFRYVEFEAATTYLDRRISDLGEIKKDWAVALQKRLIDTKSKIERKFMNVKGF